MSDATIFILVFGGLFVLRAVAATIVFFYILPRGNRCPNCDAATVRLQTGRWNRLIPSLRSSWCLECGWSGMLRHGPLTQKDDAVVPETARGKGLGLVNDRD